MIFYVYDQQDSFLLKKKIKNFELLVLIDFELSDFVIGLLEERENLSIEFVIGFIEFKLSIITLRGSCINKGQRE